MTWNVVLTSAVVAAALAAIANVLVAILNNRRLKTLSQKERIDALVRYRYTKLFSILEEIEINALDAPDYNPFSKDASKELIEIIHKHFLFIRKKWMLVKPLVGSMYRENIDVLLEQEIALTTQVYSSPSEISTVIELCELRKEIKQAIIRSIQSQLDVLLME